MNEFNRRRKWRRFGARRTRVNRTRSGGSGRTALLIFGVLVALIVIAALV